MASQVDGSIVVDTGIDTEGFNQGADALKQAMNRLQKRFDSMEKRLQNSVAQYEKALMSGNAKSIQRFSDNLDKAKDATNRFREEVSKFGNEYQSMVANIDKAQAALNRLEDRQAKLKATGVKENSKAYQNLMYDIKQAQKTLAEYKAELNEALGAKNGVDVTIVNPSQLKDFSDSIERIKERFSELQNDDGIAALVDDIDKAVSAVERYQSRIDKMSSLGATDSQWQSIHYDVSETAESAKALLEELDALNQYGGIESGQYDELSQRLQDTIRQYDELIARTGDFEDMETSPHLEDWENMITLSDMIGAAFGRVKNAALSAVTAIVHPAQTVDRLLGLIVQKALRVGASLSKMAGAAVLSGIRAMGQAAGEAAQNLTRMTARAVTGGVKRLGAWLSNAARSMLIFQRASKKSNGVLKRGFMTILRYGLGIRSLYFLFNKIRQAIKEGFQNLAKYSNEVNKSVSQVISSFGRFKNQFAASFAPVVNIAAPALANFIDLLSDATFRAGQFIAALSGQKTVIRAKEVQEDYAESLDKTKKAAKDAQRQLAGFDELNILKKPDEDETKPEDMFETVPVEHEAESFADTFKEAWINVDLTGIGDMIGGKIKAALDKIPWPDIKKSASDLGKRLATFLNGLINVPGLGKSLGKSIAEAVNAAFAFLDGFAWNFDWKGLGNAVMDTIEAACDNLDWGLINHALQGLAIGVADLLNTIFSRAEVWEKIGVTIGNGINAAVSAGITFLERFDFNQAARAIVTGLNAAIATVVWENTGRLLADLFGGALQFIRTAALEFDWAQLGTSFSNGLNEFARVMLDKILHFEWAQIGQGIAGGINAAVFGIGWNSFGTLVGRLIGGALTIAASFIRGLDYEEIQKSIEEFLSGALRRIDYYDLLTVWGVAALVVAVKKIIAKHPVLALISAAVVALGPKLGGVIHKMVGDIPWEELGANFSGAFNGIISRIDEAITGVDWAGETAAMTVGLNSFVNGIEWGTIGQTLSDLFKAALAVIGTAVAEFDWRSLGVGIAEAVNHLDIADIVSSFVTILSDSLIATLDFLEGLVGGLDWAKLGKELGKSLVRMITGIDWAEIAVKTGLLLIELFGAAVELLLGAIGGIFSGIGEFLEDIGLDAIGGFFKGLGDGMANAGAWIKEHIVDPFVKWLKDLFGIHSPSTVMAEIGGYLISGLFNGISAAWHTITDFLDGVLDGLKTTLSDTWETVSGAASTAWNGISDTLSGIAGGIASTIGGTWDDIKKSASEKLSKVAQTVSGKWNDMKTTASTAWNGLEKTVGNTISGVKRDAIAKVSEIVNETKTKWDRIKTDALSGWNGVKSSVVPKAQEIRSQVVSAFTSMQGTLSGVWSGIRSAASGAMSSVSSMVSSMANSISSRVSSIRSTVSNITSSASDALSKVADKMDNLTRKAANSVTVGGLASGGVITDGGRARSWYDSVRKYASGTLKAAGSLFVAGEAGPEIVGHVNGRTEVLNESQIAGAIYGAVLAAMGEAVKTLGGFLSQQMAANTNALLTAIGRTGGPAPIEISTESLALLERLSALSATPYQAPAYASGTVMPYEIVAEIRRSTDKITGCIDGNTEELIQAMIGAFSSQTAAITSALSALGALSGGQGGTSFNDLKDMANTWTRMFGKSPFFG